MNKSILTTVQVKKAFEEEFAEIRHKFEVLELPVSEASTCSEPYVANPGVYIFWHSERGVIKVGRHLTNSRKRALEHIKENTGGTMAELRDDQRAKLMLFNLKDSKSKHWAAALEIFFEVYLSEIGALEIKAGRLG